MVGCKVMTENSVYVFDTRRASVTRYPAGGQMRRDGESVRVLQMEPPSVGEPMVMILAGVRESCRNGEAWVTIRTTSPVIAIELVREEEGQQKARSDG